jgi:hypothetical protein
MVLILRYDFLDCNICCYQFKKKWLEIVGPKSHKNVSFMAPKHNTKRDLKFISSKK